jgi:uncharacterized small protein (DUF1192 family)
LNKIIALVSQGMCPGGIFMVEDDERGAATPPRRPFTHEIGQSLDALSVAEIGERIEMLQAEIARLEAARRFKQDSQVAAAAFFKL